MIGTMRIIHKGWDENSGILPAVEDKDVELVENVVEDAVRVEV